MHWRDYSTVLPCMVCAAQVLVVGRENENVLLSKWCREFKDATDDALNAVAWRHGGMVDARCALPTLRQADHGSGATGFWLSGLA